MVRDLSPTSDESGTLWRGIEGCGPWRGDMYFLPICDQSSAINLNFNQLFLLHCPAGISPPKLPKEVEDRLVDITNEIHDNQNEIDDLKQQLGTEQQKNSTLSEVSQTPKKKLLQ